MSIADDERPHQQQLNKQKEKTKNDSLTVKHENNLTKTNSRSLIHEDEPTTDWTPEIPFKNVSNEEIFLFQFYFLEFKRFLFCFVYF